MALEGLGCLRGCSVAIVCLVWPQRVLGACRGSYVAVGGRRRSYVSLRPSTTLQPLFKLQCAKRFFFSGPG